MLTRLGLWLLPVIAVVVAIYCTSMDSMPIQNEVRANVSDGIHDAYISGVQVAADGREIVLTGSVPSEVSKKQAGDIAASTSGVRTVDNQLVVSAPAPAPLNAKTVQTTINKILLDKKIEFQTDRDVLLPQSIPVLEDVLKVLGQAPQLAVRIEGHTDSLGDPDLNRNLSKARAEAVMNWFADHGIARTRMSALGFGADRPIAPNATSAGRFANRRVEIIAN